MEIDLCEFSSEIRDFLCVETLEKIDYGVLDLSDVRNFELKEILYDCSIMLEMELRFNYMENTTGFFRVSVNGGKCCYFENEVVLEADSLCDLRELVLSQNRIWYVFDEIRAKKTEKEILEFRK